MQEILECKPQNQWGAINLPQTEKENRYPSIYLCAFADTGCEENSYVQKMQGKHFENSEKWHFPGFNLFDSEISPNKELKVLGVV